MTAKILGKPDNLDVIGKQFERARLQQPVLLNAIPKSGTHLIRNIMRMFVDQAQHWPGEFIQHAILHQSLPAFSKANPYISWGHLLFSDEASVALRDVRHIVLVRDPYSWVLARARFYLSDEFQGNMNHIKGGAAPVTDILNMMILGVHGRVPSLLDIYTFNAVAWMNDRTTLVRYEDIIENVKDIGSSRAETFFGELLAKCGIDLPANWREKVLAGADRRQSRTASENLTLAGPEVPKALPEQQKTIVNFHAPGMRGLLGYSD